MQQFTGSGQRRDGGFTLGNIVGSVLAVCAVAMTLLTAVRVLRPARGDVYARPPVEPTEVVDSDQYHGVGHTHGPSDAPLSLAVFSDFECPFCGRFARETLAHVEATFGDSVQIVFRHMPLPGHRLAYPAARAAECAAEQGRFWEFHDELFRSQDSLGIRSFRDMARAVGVADLDRFDDCNGRAGPVDVVERDLQASKALGATGTPALVVGNVLVQGVPETGFLDSLIRDQLRSARRGTLER